MFETPIEPPPARHVLYDSDSDDEDENDLAGTTHPFDPDYDEDEVPRPRKKWTEPRAPEVKLNSAVPIEVLAVCVRAMAAIPAGLKGEEENVGTVTVYMDEDGENARTIPIFHHPSHSFHSISIPPFLDPRVCYLLAAAILDAVTPSTKVYVVAPSLTYDRSHAVSILPTTAAAKEVTGDVPLLQPPSMLTGFEAALLSQCERREVQAVAIVGRSSGVVEREHVETDVLHESAKALATHIGAANLVLDMSRSNQKLANRFGRRSTGVGSMYL
ncbi:hypothetical protein SAICODRAFT_16505 [Saitoella complicata NRRL Y-17804]|uniref:uncharacterized protein n=1 Tax=Saitoella complicata (strain BCRC 22490 / CBS 7301 / JCM 7358 / NBRC 10748 / NRRL Y-17804) TaxID=698492 RepID=UPI000867BD03|nr:uncharacterized protein SAICODRAFT_16505 [Saitoella complicata NRRL Y-17804]ODQ56505.1 hypothetical protein SAICODRAFT_16505 [Saitoella complicata NRRL Y-17804]